MAKKNKKVCKPQAKREDFIEWIRQYIDWIGFLHTTDGTVFMDMDGYDGGDVYEEDGLEGGAKFSNPDSVDKEIREACKHFREPYPTKSFKEFCKEKFGEQ